MSIQRKTINICFEIPDDLEFGPGVRAETEQRIAEIVAPVIYDVLLKEGQEESKKFWNDFFLKWERQVKQEEHDERVERKLNGDRD